MSIYVKHSSANHLASSVAPLTCRWAGTLRPVPGASWPSGCCGRSYPHRNMPPPWPWAGGPSVAPAAGQNSAVQHCSRFSLEESQMQTRSVAIWHVWSTVPLTTWVSYRNGRYRCPPWLPCPWTLPSHSHRSCLEIQRKGKGRWVFSQFNCVGRSTSMASWKG